LIAPSIEEIDRRWMPRIHRSMPWLFGANDSVERGT